MLKDLDTMQRERYTQITMAGMKNSNKRNLRSRL